MTTPSNPDQSPAIRMACDRCDLHGLAAKHVGHIDAGSPGQGDAVAALADVIDNEVFGFSHGAPR